MKKAPGFNDIIVFPSTSISRANAIASYCSYIILDIWQKVLFLNCSFKLALYISFPFPSKYSFIQVNSVSSQDPLDLTKFVIIGIIPGIKQLLLNKFIFISSTIITWSLEHLFDIDNDCKPLW